MQIFDYFPFILPELYLLKNNLLCFFRTMITHATCSVKVHLDYLDGNVLCGTAIIR